MTAERLDNWRDLALGSLLTSPFLFFSLGFHMVMFYVLGHLAWSLPPEKPNVPIPVSLIEFGSGISLDKSIGAARGPGGPRTLPKLGTPMTPREASGKLDVKGFDAASSEAVSGAPRNTEPSLPGPKSIAEAPVRAPRVNPSETSPDSLVQLPTKGAAPNLSSVTNAITQSRAATGREVGTADGVYALREGADIPGGLKGSGSSTSPYGAPGGVRDGKGATGGGTGTGAGGGSASGLKGRLSADYGEYLKLIEKRVYAVWKYPEGASGVQKVSVRFAIDRAGKLTQADVLESTDPRINASALEAMKKASPFPPIPASLSDLADEPLIIRFTVAVRMRG